MWSNYSLKCTTWRRRVGLTAPFRTHEAMVSTRRARRRRGRLARRRPRRGAGERLVDVTTVFHTRNNVCACVFVCAWVRIPWVPRVAPLGSSYIIIGLRPRAVALGHGLADASLRDLRRLERAGGAAFPTDAGQGAEQANPAANENEVSWSTLRGEVSTLYAGRPR